MMRLSIVDQAPIPAGGTAIDAFRNTIELAILADSLGYARYWLAEHHGMAALASVSPEVLISRVAAETTNIRVGSGAVLLPNYAPLKVAENFLTLHALYPGRIDLGIGRAPRQASAQSQALRRDRGDTLPPDDFVGQLLELRAFLERRFPQGHPFADLKISPFVTGYPELWLLGSSPASAALAAELGLPYAFGHFIEPQWTREAINRYRSQAKTSPHPAGGPILTVGVICADTQAEAQRQFASTRLLYRQLGQGISGLLPAPDEAVAAIGLELGPLMPENGEWPHYIVGDPDYVKLRLDRMIAELGVQELMVACLIHDHLARLRSHQLLAEIYL